MVFRSWLSSLVVACRESMYLISSNGGVALKRSSLSFSPFSWKSLATHLDRTNISPTPWDLSTSTHFVLMKPFAVFSYASAVLTISTVRLNIWCISSRWAARTRSRGSCAPVMSSIAHSPRSRSSPRSHPSLPPPLPREEHSMSLPRHDLTVLEHRPVEHVVGMTLNILRPVIFEELTWFSNSSKRQRSVSRPDLHVDIGIVLLLQNLHLRLPVLDRRRQVADVTNLFGCVAAIAASNAFAAVFGSNRLYI